MDRTAHSRWTPADGQALQALREDAATLLADQFRPYLMPIWNSLCDDPQAAARADARSHLDALQAALTRSAPRNWLDYVSWLQQVLVNRGAEPDLLAHSLTQLAGLYAQRLPEPTRGRVTASLRATAQVLHAEHDDALHYGGVGPKPWKECNAFRNALLAGDHSLSATLFDEVLAAHGDQVSTAVHMVQPALYDIGRQWQLNTVSVTQEHLATAIVEALLAQASGGVRSTAARGCRVVLARAPANHHAVGLRIVADAFESAGWDTQLLPEPASTGNLVSLLRQHPPQLLGLSAALPLHLLTLRELLRQLRETLGEAMPRVIVGGLAVNQYPEIAGATGAIVVGPDAERMIAMLPALEQAA
jgi:methanogenic corrinoid protein MtbC1